MTSAISIIIPTLNEEHNIASLAENLVPFNHEVIIIDGGSSDDTADRAMEAGFKVIHSTPGRGVQLNRGAQLAEGEILLFLHADTLLPADFEEQIYQTIGHKDCIAGAFHLAIEDGTFAMNFIAACANFRSRIWQLPYGDQAIFIEKKKYFELGMYPELPIMEDYLFISEAKKHGTIYLAGSSVFTSARRWKRLGVLHTTLINQCVILGYRLGISPERLALLYRR